jgi:hypothetical protein
MHIAGSQGWAFCARKYKEVHCHIKVRSGAISEPLICLTKCMYLRTQTMAECLSRRQQQGCSSWQRCATSTRGVGQWNSRAPCLCSCCTSTSTSKHDELRDFHPYHTCHTYGAEQQPKTFLFIGYCFLTLLFFWVAVMAWSATAVNSRGGPWLSFARHSFLLFATTPLSSPGSGRYLSGLQTVIRVAGLKTRILANATFQCARVLRSHCTYFYLL